MVARETDIIIVPETSIFYRKKKQKSLLTATEQSDVVVPPSSLFEPQSFAALVAQNNEADKRRADISDEDQLSLEQRLARRLNACIDQLYSSTSLVTRPIMAASPRLRTGLLRLIDPIKRRALPPRRFPRWLLAQWRDIHEVEPAIFPEEWLLNSIPEYRVPRSRIAATYVDLCRQYGSGISHLVLVPWLKPGGADLEALNYVRALAMEGLAEQVVVMATSPTDSPWAQRLPEGVRFAELGAQAGSLWYPLQEDLLTRIWLQMRPAVVHIINSELAYRVLARHGPALRNVSRVFASTFCRDISAEGKNDGYPFRYLPACIDSLDGVFCDNQTFLDELVQIYGFDRQMLYVHYQPVRVSPAPRTPPATKLGQLEIVWAGRLDRQKRADILLAIAEACRSLPVRFHVYGSVLLDQNVISADDFAGRDNLVYHGPFNRFSAIPTSAYHVFLHTAQWEGLPNILMEAISAGLPVIASDAGGVGELISNGDTGFLITPYDDVSQYVDQINTICTDPGVLARLAENARRLVAERHSWERFAASVRAVPGYTDPHVPTDDHLLELQVNEEYPVSEKVG
jgi:glycosyltransferase involved in cell wall biosynthesis